MTHQIEKKRVVFYGVLAIFIALLLLFLVARFPYTIVSSYFRLNAANVSKDIVVVTLDEATLNSQKFKRYQDITRCDYASLLRNVLYDDPKVVAVDAVFYQQSGNVACDRELRGVLEKNPQVIVGVEYDEERKLMQKDLFWQAWGSESIGYVNATSYNTLNIFGSSWGDYRNRVKIYDRSSSPVLPLSIEAYLRANKLEKKDVSNGAVSLDGYIVPLDEDEFVNVNFFTKAYKSISFLEVIEGEYDRGVFENKVVFVGATAPDIHDDFFTPYDTTTTMPGVMIHANLYNTLTAKQWIEYENIVAFLLVNILVLVVFVFLIARTANIILGALLWLSIIGGYVAYSIGSFMFLGRLVEVFPLIVSSIFVSLAVYLRKFLEERHSKDQVKTIFSRYISEDVANELLKLGIDSMKLGGAERNISVFFSDLAGFTDLSEKLTPEELGRVLNVYFEEMSSVILLERGTIDKFIGDAIMAFWNAPLDLPNYADHACRAAILQRRAMDRVREEVRALGCDVSLDMRIGIHSGPAIIGNFWCSKRYDYTALGDTVNLASRLESINKQYGTNVIISESTYELLTPDMFFVRELDMITVKGKTEPVKIYELIGFSDDTEVIKEDEKRRFELYTRALELYRDRQFKEARRLFYVIGDVPSKKFVERCEEFIMTPPPPEWDGVYRFKVK